jgi:hypothetical protein
VETLEHVEHRAVLVLEQTRMDVHLVIRRNADDVLVKRAMVD